ncbi:hypothetical protein Tsubulata_046677 [Turnera subulata]|uniref:Uncharacterized protein n=1 Tax=Turnera subulata TaxID=218843 RepID=A0A9Q0G059_9ROSI|nr:hypothetical protein Tsubulata_046677 [Turnera subulata]
MLTGVNYVYRLVNWDRLNKCLALSTGLLMQVKPEIVISWSPRIIVLHNFLSSQGLDGQSGPNSIRGGCAVLEGEKWSATKWMRRRTAI